jgi:hypothetical protein
MTVTWQDIAAITETRDGKRAWRDGRTRAWHIPSPTGGTLQAEVTLRPRWCDIAVDRIRTTDRDQVRAGPWFEQHIWPYVHRALRARKTGSGLLPAGRTFACATPVERAAVPELLAAWLDAELGWGVRADDQWPEFAPHNVIPGPAGDYA